MDVSKQIEYWINTATDDIQTANLDNSDEDKDFCGILMSYQLEGRYPEYYPESPSRITALDYLSKTKTFYSWLKAKLSK